MATQIQLRRGTAAQWTTADPVLANGEPGVETDTGKFKIGNGTSAWSALAYAGSDGTGFSAAQVYYGYDATQFGPDSITPNPPDGSFAVGVDPAFGWYDVHQRINGAWVDTDPDSNNIQEALVRNAAREETTGLALDALLDFYGAPITEITVLTTIFQTAFTAGQAAAWLDVAKGTLKLGINCNTTDRDTLLGLFTPGYPLRGNVATAGNWDGYVTSAIASAGTWGTGVFVSLRLFDDASVANASSAMSVPDALVPQLWTVEGSSVGALFNTGVFGAVDVSNRFLVKNNENTRWVAGPVMEDFVVDDNATTSSVWDAQAQQIVMSVNQNLLNDIDADIADKAPLASPTFTGVPAAPTAAAGTNTTQVATTEFVTTAVGDLVIPDALEVITWPNSGFTLLGSAFASQSFVTVGGDGSSLNGKTIRFQGYSPDTGYTVTNVDYVSGEGLTNVTLSGSLPADVANATVVELLQVDASVTALTPGTDVEITVSGGVASISAATDLSGYATEAYVDGRVEKYAALPVKTADYTLALGDAGDLIQMDATTTITLTVPENATVAFPVGTRIDILGTNTGTVTVAAASGTVKVDSKDGNLSLAGRWSGATLIKRATDDWVLVGDLA